MRTNNRRTVTGTVISEVMDKTVVVQVESRKPHPKYKKFITRRKNYKAHDETNECRLGDTVICTECRPISKTKRWRISEILRRKYVSTEEIVETDELVMKKETPQHIVEEQAAAQDEEETAEGAEEDQAAAEETAAETEPAGGGDDDVSAGEDTGTDTPEEDQQQAETGESDDTGRNKA